VQIFCHVQTDAEACEEADRSLPIPSWDWGQDDNWHHCDAKEYVVTRFNTTTGAVNSARRSSFAPIAQAERRATTPWTMCVVAKRKAQSPSSVSGIGSVSV
jgi:hypothetical protein